MQLTLPAAHLATSASLVQRWVAAGHMASGGAAALTATLARPAGFRAVLEIVSNCFDDACLCLEATPAGISCSSLDQVRLLRGGAVPLEVTCVRPAPGVLSTAQRRADTCCRHTVPSLTPSLTARAAAVCFSAIPGKLLRSSLCAAAPTQHPSEALLPGLCSNREHLVLHVNPKHLARLLKATAGAAKLLSAVSLHVGAAEDRLTMRINSLSKQGLNQSATYHVALLHVETGAPEEGQDRALAPWCGR